MRDLFNALPGPPAVKALLAVLILITFVPSLVTGLPNLVMGGG